MQKKSIFARVLGLGALSSSLLWAPAAHALRPYDGTDASVAEAGVFELEFSPLGYIRDGSSRTLVAPYAVANFGIPGDFEIVLEGRVNRQQGGEPEGYRTSLGDTALSVKHVLRQGSLQDGGSGVSVAAECGILLPEVHGASGQGATCAGIVSQKFTQATMHLNLAVTRTREHTESRFLGVIVEGNPESALHPVAEVFTERDNAGSRTHSGLVGLVWKKSEQMAFDLGLRHAHSDGHAVNELRMGLTWSSH